MTEAEALENVATMRRHTRKDAFKRLLEVAVGPMGNLSPEARAVYRRELDRMGDV